MKNWNQSSHHKTERNHNKMQSGMLAGLIIEYGRVIFSHRGQRLSLNFPFYYTASNRNAG